MSMASLASTVKANVYAVLVAPEFAVTIFSKESMPDGTNKTALITDNSVHISWAKMCNEITFLPTKKCDVTTFFLFKKCARSSL